MFGSFLPSLERADLCSACGSNLVGWLRGEQAAPDPQSPRPPLIPIPIAEALGSDG